MNQSLSCSVAQLPSNVMRTMFGIPEFSFAQWLSLADAHWCCLTNEGRGSLVPSLYGYRDERLWSPAAAYKRNQSPQDFVAQYVRYLDEEHESIHILEQGDPSWEH